LGQVQLFAVHRLEEQDEISQTTTAAGTDLSRSRYNQREDVARLAWQKQAGALKLEAGAEGAINVLSSRSILTVGGAPVILPAANLRVEEDRAEFFTTATWRLGPALVSEVGARYEISTLKQSGDSNLTKDLSFFKPRWLTSWDFAEGHQLRFLVERRVGQLEFRDFASSTSLNSNIVTAGNKIWSRSALACVFDLGTAFLGARLADGGGAPRNGFPCGGSCPVFAGSRVFDAVGNIGNGLNDVVQINLILPLDEVGLTGFTSQERCQFSRIAGCAIPPPA
jgi:hypothetical protein